MVHPAFPTLLAVAAREVLRDTAPVAHAVLLDTFGETEVLVGSPLGFLDRKGRVDRRLDHRLAPDNAFGLALNVGGEGAGVGSPPKASPMRH